MPAIRIGQGSSGGQTSVHGTITREALSSDEQGPDRGRGGGLPPYEELPSQAAPADGKGPCPDRGHVSKEAEGILPDRKGICGVMEACGREEVPLPLCELLYGPEDAWREGQRQAAGRMGRASAAL